MYLTFNRHCSHISMFFCTFFLPADKLSCDLTYTQEQNLERLFALNLYGQRQHNEKFLYILCYEAEENVVNIFFTAEIYGIDFFSIGNCN